VYMLLAGHVTGWLLTFQAEGNKAHPGPLRRIIFWRSGWVRRYSISMILS
jgi:hypothetical protein